MGMNINQRNVTRNQSTADYQQKKVFIFDNRFIEGVYRNTTGANLSLTAGMLVARSKTVPNGFVPITALNLADVIGIASHEGVVVLPNNTNLGITVCKSGSVDGNLLLLPATVTLNTVVGEKVLLDVLNSLGFTIVQGSTEHGIFDN